MKLLKYLLISILGIFGTIQVLIVMFIGIKIIDPSWHIEKFRFENFKTAEELISFIESNFPEGSDGGKLMTLLDNTGAERQTVPAEYYNKNDKELGTYSLYQYFYHTGWISLWPLINYSVTLNMDENRKILHFSVGKYEGF